MACLLYYYRVLNPQYTENNTTNIHKSTPGQFMVMENTKQETHKVSLQEINRKLRHTVIHTLEKDIHPVLVKQIKTLFGHQSSTSESIHNSYQYISYSHNKIFTNTIQLNICPTPQQTPNNYDIHIYTDSIRDKEHYSGN